MPAKSRSQRILVVLVVTFALMAVGLSSGVADAQPVFTYRVFGTGGLGLAERPAPNTGGARLAVLSEGAPVYVVCSVIGELVVATVNGRTVRWDRWDRLTDGRYVSDVWVSSRPDAIPRCTDPSTGPTSTGSAADAAVSWAIARVGSSAYEGWCERFVENAYGTGGRYPSALADWNSAVARGVAHGGDVNPPKGALVFWDLTPPYGHVGLALGDGRFVATSVRGGVGIQTLPYWGRYLGWAPANF